MFLMTTVQQNEAHSVFYGDEDLLYC